MKSFTERVEELHAQTYPNGCPSGCESCARHRMAGMSREDVKTFVAQFGIPWWVTPDAELLALCPLRFRP